MLKEFRDFIMTKNLIELSVAVILAGAVGLVVTGFTNDIMMPIIGQFTGGMDFSEMKVILSDAVLDADGNIVTPENAILYGKWINTLINLLIVGFILFIISKGYKKVQKKKEEAPAPPPGPTKDQELLMEIRDLLKK